MHKTYIDLERYPNFNGYDPYYDETFDEENFDLEQLDDYIEELDDEEG